MDTDVEVDVDIDRSLLVQPGHQAWVTVGVVHMESGRPFVNMDLQMPTPQIDTEYRK